MHPTSYMQDSCLEFLIAPVIQKTKESLQLLANSPNMPVKGPVGSFNYAWFTNRKAETQMVENEAE